MDITLKLLPRFLFLCMLVWAPLFAQVMDGAESEPDAIPEIEAEWVPALQKRIMKVDNDYQGAVHAYVEDIYSGAEMSYGGEEPIYLASVVKIFVLIELMRRIDETKLDWNDKIVITKDHYRDGGGKINWVKEGGKVRVRRIADLMMTLSDNSATDIAIHLVGLDNVIKTARHLGVTDLMKMTTMLEIRRDVYRSVHPVFGTLTNMQFIELAKNKRTSDKAAFLTKLFDKKGVKFTAEQVSLAYQNFYKKNYNTASLKSIASILKKITLESDIAKKHRKKILSTLLECKTGKNRIKAALPKGWKFGHKTGTQYKRSCDVGLLFSPKKKKYVMAICLKDFNSTKSANRQYQKIAKAFFEVIKKKESTPKP